MGRPHRGTYRGNSYSKSKNRASNQSQNLPKKVDEENKVNKVEMKSPSMKENVKSGFGFGVGSAVAHSAIASLSTMASGIRQDVGNGERENKKLENCAGLLKKYVDCLQIHNYSDIQPECVEIKKMIETMNCNE
jgi:hypothetical protein